MGCLFLRTITDSYLKKVPLAVPLQVSLPLFENNFRFLRHWIGDVPALRKVWFLDNNQRFPVFSYRNSGFWQQNG